MCQPIGGSVTTQPTGPAAPAPPSAAEQTKPFRQVIAFVLLGGTAVLLLVAFARLLLQFDDFSGTFTERAYFRASDFLDLIVIAAIAVAVLIATHVRPAVAMARILTIVALAAVGFAAFFGLISMFAGFAYQVGATGPGDARDAFEY